MNIGIIGVGRLGIAYALAFEKNGFDVFASSYKDSYIQQLQSKKISTVEPGIAELLKESNNITFTTNNHLIIDQCNFIYVMVATPSTAQGDYDISAVETVVDDFINHPGDVSNKILLIGSTVNPGTCDSLQKRLVSRGVHVVYSPTFVAQGTVLDGIKNERVLIGTDNLALDQPCRDVFSKIVEPGTPMYQVSPRTGEILKLAGNCWSILQISYYNMMSQIMINSGLEKDITTASQYLNEFKPAAKWKPGFGYGGPCYPRDNQSLVHYTKTLGMDYPLGTLVDEFNNSHVEFLTEHFLSKNVDKNPFYFEYISYKKDVNIFEESHQLRVCERLLQSGAAVYVEQTKFLTSEIVLHLSTNYPNIKFIKIEILKKLGVEVFDTKL